MDPELVETITAKYRQLAAICALLGGLAFAAAMSILSKGASGQALSRPASITSAFAMASAAVQIVATIGWTSLVLYVDTDLMTEETRRYMGRWSSMAYILGVFLLFVSIGMSGWIASRWLGVITAIIGALSGIFTLSVILRFVS